MCVIANRRCHATRNGVHDRAISGLIQCILYYTCISILVSKGHSPFHLITGDRSPFDRYHDEILVSAICTRARIIIFVTCTSDERRRYLGSLGVSGGRTRSAYAARAGGTRRKEGIHKIRRILHGRKTRYRHGLPTHDNKNPMFTWGYRNSGHFGLDSSFRILKRFIVIYKGG
jgi:hypothetical protein